MKERRVRCKACGARFTVLRFERERTSAYWPSVTEAVTSRNLRSASDGKPSDDTVVLLLGFTDGQARVDLQ